MRKNKSSTSCKTLFQDEKLLDGKGRKLNGSQRKMKSHGSWKSQPTTKCILFNEDDYLRNGDKFKKNEDLSKPVRKGSDKLLQGEDNLLRKKKSSASCNQSSDGTKILFQDHENVLGKKNSLQQKKFDRKAIPVMEQVTAISSVFAVQDADDVQASESDRSSSRIPKRDMKRTLSQPSSECETTAQVYDETFTLHNLDQTGT